MYVESVAENPGAAVARMPTHFSHLLRDWLPRFWACRELMARQRLNLFVPAVAQPLYDEIIQTYTPGASMTSEPPCSSTRCRHNASEVEYWRAYGAERGRLMRGQPCHSADIVFALRGVDPRMAAARRAMSGLKGMSGTERRTLANPEEAWAAVERIARRHRATAERLCFEDLPFAEQRRRVCNTSVLVAQHGGAIGHALWSTARPRVAVLQLPPWGDARAWWGGILASNGIALLLSEAHRVAPLASNVSIARKRDGKESSRGTLVVDVAALEADLIRALATAGRHRQDGTGRSAGLVFGSR